ncbi:MAG: efflux RND transporter periplasmic adaptor subunit [Alphaproteobacteria bacterium]
MNKSIITALALAVLAVGWILSGQFGTDDAIGEDTIGAATQAATAPMKVRVTDLKAITRVDTVDVTGRTEASRTVQLRSETKGQVNQLYVRRGEYITAGSPIAKLRLDDRPAKLAEASATLKQREIEYKAASQLNERGFRSETEKAAALARLDAARAVVEQIRIDIARTTFEAPFDGIMGAEHVELGDYMRVGDVAATVVDLDPILVVGQVSERHVGKLAVGMSGTMRLIDGSQRDGIVRYVSAVADPDTLTKIQVPVNSGIAHFVTPSTLTLNDEGVVGVKTVNVENVVVFNPVDIIADEPDGVWLGGLPESIRLITVGQEFVIDGEKVVPVPGPARIVTGPGS